MIGDTNMIGDMNMFLDVGGTNRFLYVGDTNIKFDVGGTNSKFDVGGTNSKFDVDTNMFLDVVGDTNMFSESWLRSTVYVRDARFAAQI